MTLRRHHPCGRLGFTLIELMVVIVLIAIMTAVIIPEMRGTFEDALLRSASRDLVNVCGVAHSRAVSFGEPHRVRLDPRTGKYRLEHQPENAPAPGFVPARDVPGGEGKIDSRITVRLRQAGEGAPTEPTTVASSPGEDDATTPAGDPVITFYPDGTADAVEIQLQDREDFRLLLRINPVTARLRVVDRERELAATPPAEPEAEEAERP